MEIKSAFRKGKSGIVTGIFFFLMISVSFLSAQTVGTIVSFSSINNVVSNAGTIYTFSNPSNQLNVTVINAGTGANAYPEFRIALPQTVNLTNYAFLRVKVRSTNFLNLRIDYESAGRTTNGAAVVKSVTGNNVFDYYTFSITGGNFTQCCPQVTPSTVDPSTVSALRVYFNAGATGNSVYNGTVVFDSIWVGDYTGTLTPPPAAVPKDIHMNQLGFYPKGPKLAIVPGTANLAFSVVDSAQSVSVYNGTLSASSYWDASDENVSVADFTSLTTSGTYFVSIPGYAFSNNFRINDSVHKDVAKAGLKMFYFQRASTPITSQYGGIFARAAGHPDNSVRVHSSAASTARPTNTIISSPRGWYDAGDYNKYIVNSGISVYTLLAILETYPYASKNWQVNIPESGNGLPDVLNEALWNIRWMLTMQEPSDGGVYHKLTETNFSGFQMPSQVTALRYVVQKSTAATLDFAAVMAQTARIVKKYPSLVSLSDSCLNAALAAWKWAKANPTVYYNQSTLNANHNPDINTGEYGNTNVDDEFHWAALELYITTKADSFYTHAGGVLDGSLGLPGWADVRTLGYYSLANNLKNLTSVVDSNSVKQLMINMADDYTYDVVNSPYRMAMNRNLYYWGSNSNAANQSIAQFMAFKMTNNISYYNAAIQNLDYILGRNPTGYSFITGFGKKSSKNPHHRPSSADGILNPIPGFMVGGPQPDHSADGCSGYPSSLRAKSYLDAECSYSTNEVAINWNAPFTFISFSAEFALRENILNKNTLTDISLENSDKVSIKLYPNPSSSTISLLFPDNENYEVEILDLGGKSVLSFSSLSKEKNQLDISLLNSGVYLVKVHSQGASYVLRLIKT